DIGGGGGVECDDRGEGEGCRSLARGPEGSPPCPREGRTADRKPANSRDLGTPAGWHRGLRFLTNELISRFHRTVRDDGQVRMRRWCRPLPRVHVARVRRR